MVADVSGSVARLAWTCALPGVVYMALFTAIGPNWQSGEPRKPAAKPTARKAAVVQKVGAPNPKLTIDKPASVGSPPDVQVPPPDAVPVAPPVIAGPEQPAPPETKRNAKGEPLVTNVFVDTELKQAITDIATQAGVTVISDATVQGSVSTDLKEVVFDKALSMLLQVGGFAFVKQDGYYLVGLPEPTNPNYHLLSKTEVVDLKHTSPTAIIASLGASFGKYITSDWTAPTVDAGAPRDRQMYRQTGMNGQQWTGAGASSTGAAGAAGTSQRSRVVINAPQTILDRIKADIALLDLPERQVMLEAAVVEITEEALKTVGVDWATRFFSQNLTSGGSSLVYSNVSSTEVASVAALVQNGKARLRAHPRVATIEGQTAEIEVGRETYFSIVTGPVTYPYTTLQQITSGILLRITPRVLEPEGEIVARVEPEVRDVTGRGPNGLPEITLRRAATSLRVKNGDSIVVGGLMTESGSNAESRIPLLSDIPLIGQIFRRTTVKQSRSEVVIIITPHILDAAGRFPGQPALPK